MEIVGMILMGLGSIGVIVTGIWLLILAFQESILWGLGYIFVPFVSLIFVIMHWDKAAKPFLIGLACILPMVLGMFLAGSAAFEGAVDAP